MNSICIYIVLTAVSKVNRFRLTPIACGATKIGVFRLALDESPSLGRAEGAHSGTSTLFGSQVCAVPVVCPSMYALTISSVTVSELVQKYLLAQ